MSKILTHKTQIFPNKEQIDLIEQAFGMRRFFFNRTLMELKHRFNNDLYNNKKNITRRMLTEMQKDIFRSKYKELTKTVPSVILNTAMEDLQSALTSLWSKSKWKKNKNQENTNKNRIRKGKLSLKNDILLRKKKDSNTARWQRKDATSFKYSKEKGISLILLGFITMATPLKYEFSDNIKVATIKKEAGKYYISIVMGVQDSEIKTFPKTYKHVAFDWGINTFMTGFDGKEHFSLNFDKSLIKKKDKIIALRQRCLSKKKRFSSNWYKAKTKLQLAYKRKENYIDEFIKYEVFKLVNKYDSITLEDLNMSFVMKNSRLARVSSRQPYYKFKIIAFNKFSHSDKKIFLVDNKFPSTQVCSCCGNVKTKEDKMKLGEKVYKCKACNFEIDRDENAAINIYNNPEKTEFTGY